METNRRWPVRRIVGAVAFLGFILWRVSVLFVGSKLEIGPETTFVDGPLTADGRINYETALHERFSQGITPENNAAVLIDRAFGPAAISPPLRARYFARLGIEPLPDRGDYVVTQTALTQQKLDGAPDRAEQQEAIFKELGRAQQRAWKKDECPLAAEWLAANEKSLELIEEATKRSHFYSPLVTLEQLLAGESNIQNSREAARLLVSRAMFRLGENDVAGAWSDILACHRLSRLVGERSQTMIQFLVAVALDAVATAGDAALIAHGMSAEQARQCLADHIALPSLGNAADVMHGGERLVSLDAMQFTAGGAGFDLNVTLRRTNRMFDNTVAAMKLKGAQNRREAFAKLEADLDQRVKAARQPLRLVANYVINSRKAISEMVGDTLLALLTPAFTQAQNADDRARIKSDLVRVGFALAAYRAELGGYPKELDALVPKYLDVLPSDRMVDQPLRYVVRENGFLLYSVGANGRDDDGVMSGQKNQDDVVFEVSPH